MNAIEEFGKMMGDQMRQVNKANKSTGLELGTMVKNLALRVPSLANAIPRGDYMISSHLAAGETETTESETDGHTHSVENRALRVGDRVLVAWAGSEPVVIDIVISS